MSGLLQDSKEGRTMRNRHSCDTPDHDHEDEGLLGGAITVAKLAEGIAGSYGMMPDSIRFTTCAMTLWALQGDDSLFFTDEDVSAFIEAADCKELQAMWNEGGDAVVLTDKIAERTRVTG